MKKHQQLPNVIINCHSIDDNTTKCSTISTSSIDDSINQLPSNHGDFNSSLAPSESLLESLIDKVNRLKEENQLLTASLIK